jgi:hypothetical protein
VLQTLEERRKKERDRKKPKLNQRNIAFILVGGKFSEAYSVLKSIATINSFNMKYDMKTNILYQKETYFME